MEAAVEGMDANEEEVERLTENLAQYVLQPLNVNTASAGELARIPGLDPRTALNVALYRNRHGRFNSIDSLRAVEGVTESALEQARPFLTASHGPRSRFLSSFRLRNLHAEAIQRMGKRTTRELPSTEAPNRLYTRVSAHAGHRLDVNLTLEKDPGEVFRWQPASHMYGYDFLSAHVALHNLGRLKTLIVGDYATEFGQGLLLWSGSTFGKGGDPARAPVRSGTGLRPYRSSNEFYFFRGVGAAIAVDRRITATLFASRRRRDAAPGADCPAEASCRNGLRTSGLHRSPYEVGTKNALPTTLVGGAVEYAWRGVKAGVAGYHNRFSAPLAPGDVPYRHFAPSGKTATAFSAYASVQVSGLMFFGEAARTDAGSVAGTGGVRMDVSGLAHVVVAARHYPPAFANLYGHPFGERSDGQNETGAYAGIAITPARHWTVSGYFDQYRFPWLRYGVWWPSQGHDAALRLSYEPGARMNVSVQGRTKSVERGVAVQDGFGRSLRSVAPANRRSLRLSAQYAFSRSFRARARIERVYASEPDTPQETGWLLYQDVRWRPHPFLRLDARLTYFDTDGYAARVYALENGLLYTFSAPAFFGRGERVYLLARLDPLPGVTLQLKYGLTWRRDSVATPARTGEATARHTRDLNLLLRLAI
ncbi:MAG TPA: helix-hairpin-helix domain-containing protein [Rhodothermales bacterium]|nr:helix-hairpin-helix domain-containing protein [Rhodothermales bacterium]